MVSYTDPKSTGLPALSFSILAMCDAGVQPVLHRLQELWGHYPLLTQRTERQHAQAWSLNGIFSSPSTTVVAWHTLGVRPGNTFLQPRHWAALSRPTPAKGSHVYNVDWIGIATNLSVFLPRHARTSSGSFSSFKTNQYYLSRLQSTISIQFFQQIFMTHHMCIC